jgi:predicted ribosome quality control (RQC) complex YloA/Tae2 family protein
MTDYSQLKQALRTFFNVEDGLPEEVSRRMLLSSKSSSEARASFMSEVRAALADASLSWRSMLLNEDYEVVDVATEEEARKFAHRNLVAPFTIGLQGEVP